MRAYVRALIGKLSQAQGYLREQLGQISGTSFSTLSGVLTLAADWSSTV